MNRISFLILFFLSFCGYGQTELSGPPQEGVSQTSQEDTIPPITAYKIISIENDTTHVDTSLTIQDNYRFNYLRKDNFELLPFSNVGRPYNRLAYAFHEDDVFPRFVAQARHFNFMEVEDIYYYNVPTPFTELFFKTVFEQGQILDAFFTVNTSPNLNFSLAYKGLRSLGKFQHILTSTGNFRATLNYQTNNERYHLKAHFVSQDLLNEENGGLQPIAVQQYASGNEEFEDRSLLEVNFEDAQSTLFGKRFYINHSYDLVKASDSLANNTLSFGHIFNFSDKKYLYEQTNAHPLFGPSYENSNLRDEVNLEKLYNEVSVSYGSEFLGNIKAKAALTNYNYGYNSVLELEAGRIGNRLIGNIIALGGEYAKPIGEFDFYAEGMLNLSGNFTGHNFKAAIGYSFSNNTEASVSIKSNNQAPNFNFLLYQSDYVNYNWQNNFFNIDTKSLSASLLSSQFLNIEANYTRINNYTFFGIGNDSLILPKQHDGIVNYFKLKAQKELKWGKIALNNTLLYQKVLDGENVLNVPSFVTRNTLYYTDYWFRKALFLQTGLTLHYFTNYDMNGYDPVLAEFYVQNELELGGYPRVDFFFNAKVRQTRIFFKLEHVNSLLMGNNNFSAPLYPYRDFAVRFGLVWNFFI